MSLFGNKKNKNESLHTLSESEIQKKLYGGVLPGGRPSAPAKESLTPSQPVKPAEPEKPSSPAPIKNPPKVETPAPEEEPDLFSQPTTPSVVEEETVAPLDEEITPIEEEIPQLEEEPPVEEEKAVPTPVVVPEEKKEEKQQIREFVERENEVVSQTPAPPKISHRPKSIYRPQPAPQRKTTTKFGPLWTGFLKGAKVFGQTLIHFGGVILAGAIGLLLKIDFRKPHVRKIFYWLGAVLLLVSLLTAIHFLNVNREKAMNTEGGGTSTQTTQLQGTTRTGSETAANTGTMSATQQAVAERQTGGSQTQSSGSDEAQATQGGSGVTSAQGGQPSAPAAVKKKAYVIQVATYAIEADAERVVDRFNGVNINSFVKPLKRPSGRLYYCVFLGEFSNYENAENALAEFKKTDAAKPFQDAFVRRI